MKRYKNILLAFDGSSDSLKALETAETLALDHDATLTVVHVQEKNENNAVYYDNSVDNAFDISKTGLYVGTENIPPRFESSPSHNQTVLDENRPDKVLSDARENFESDIPIGYQTLIGHAAHAIIDYAKQDDTDLIVIGNRGINGIKKLVMGSVSQKVTNDAECAVLVVK
ncbi:universal stress protein [Virgibacillus sp. MSJ-26]|uniref:universal stress protein n=1 Tax=Virgibacillus sp. MSJ-26 TaxID=2841522 RepID=UPI001C122912|nr:universal stress protein [Virgibacillus sp. MSJ-26]MBU5466222.1 universal stress protein [Virgibacillus sp. MSJ-26]